MHKTIIEDWEFDIEVLSAKPCRMGFEPGDRFHCMYEVPAGFCPKTMAVLHSLCEAARSGGDYTLLGGADKNNIEFMCADGAVAFSLTARHKDI